MPKYVSFFSYSPEATRGMVENPQDRAAAAARVIESQGGRLESFYWMFGPHDGFVVIDVPDSASAAAVSLAIGSTGAISGLETHELFEPADLAGLAEKAKAVRETYRPPGT